MRRRVSFYLGGRSRRASTESQSRVFSDVAQLTDKYTHSLGHTDLATNQTVQQPQSAAGPEHTSAGPIGGLQPSWGLMSPLSSMIRKRHSSISRGLGEER